MGRTTTRRVVIWRVVRRPSTGAGCYSSGASPACYTRSLTCLTVLGGVSGRVQLLKACSGRGMAYKYLFDLPGRSRPGGRARSQS